MNDRSKAVEKHFLGKSLEVRAIYDRLSKTVDAFGDWIEDPKQTSIHFNRRTAFLGVVVRKQWIIVTIKSDREIESARVTKSQRTSASRWHHEVKLFKPSDIDAELKAWLRSAYELSA